MISNLFNLELEPRQQKFGSRFYKNYFNEIYILHIRKLKKLLDLGLSYADYMNLFYLISPKTGIFLTTTYIIHRTIRMFLKI